MTANNEYKFKQWNADNKSCRRTTIGPTFGGPINRLEQINHINTDGQSRPTEFVAYGTADKVVGLVSSVKIGRGGAVQLVPTGMTFENSQCIPRNKCNDDIDVEAENGTIVRMVPPRNTHIIVQKPCAVYG